MITAHLQFQEFIIGHLLGTKSNFPAPDDDGFFIDLPNHSPNLVDFSTFSPALQPFDGDPRFVTVSPLFLSEPFRLSIEFYFRLSVDTAEHRVYRFDADIAIVVPNRENAPTSLARQCLDVLFSAIGTANVVRVFRAILLEHRLLFLGSDIYILTMCVLSVLTLPRPMTYRCALLPYLPDDEDFLPFLESPVPFCFGVLHTDTLSRFPLPSDATIVRLDDHEVVYPDDVAHLPSAVELRSALKQVLQRARSVVPKRPERIGSFWAERRLANLAIRMKQRLNLKYSFCDADADALMRVFSGYLEKFLANVPQCRVRDTTDPANPKFGFVKEVYMMGVPPSSLEFVEQFIQTQTFAAYFENAVTADPNARLTM
jgi:hypothetical protein